MRVVIVGAGTSGIATAIELVNNGYGNIPFFMGGII